MPTPPPPASDTKKGPSGCLLAFSIAAGLAALVIVVLGVGGWLFFRSERGQKIVKGISQGATLMQEAMKAPGTAALRAAGCTQAMVFPTSQAIEILSLIAPDAVKDIPASLEDTKLVMCQIDIKTDSNVEGPGCAQVARTYSDAVSEAPDRFAVMVQHQGRPKSNCEGSYTRNGTFLGSLEPPKPKQR